MAYPAVLLLDFDGPLYSARAINHMEQNRDPVMIGRVAESMREMGDHEAAANLSYWKMDPVAVDMLNGLMQLYPFETVISSTWRRDCSISTIKYLFDINGLKLKLHEHWRTDLPPPGHTPGTYRYIDRLTHVSQWIKEHEHTVGSYAVLDDWDSGDSLQDPVLVRNAGLDPSKIVLVDYFNGIGHEDYLRLKELLK